MDYIKEYQKISTAVIEEHRKVFERLDMGQLKKALDLIINASTIFVYAAGREGISLRGFAMRLAHMGKTVHWAFDDTAVGIQPGDLFIISEGSGDVGSFDYYLRKVKEAGGTVLMFTGNPDGVQVKKYADYFVFIKATAYLAERYDVVPTIQMMGNQYEQHLYMFCDVLIMLAMKMMRLTYKELEEKHRNIE